MGAITNKIFLQNNMVTIIDLFDFDHAYIIRISQTQTQSFPGTFVGQQMGS